MPYPIALSFETNALEVFTQFNVTIACYINSAEKLQMQQFMQHYSKLNPAAISSAAEIFFIKNLVKGEKICRSVPTTKKWLISVQ